MNLESLTLGFLAGLVLGVVYLLALWYTVRRVARTGQRSLLLVSFVARLVVLLLGFYALVGLGAQGLVAALLGFIVARAVMTRVLGRSGPLQTAGAASLSPDPAPKPDHSPTTSAAREELD